MGASYKFIKNDTDVFGLKYQPKLSLSSNNGADWISGPEEGSRDFPIEHFTEEDSQVLETIFNKVKSNTKFIVEIGVHKPYPPESVRSSTNDFKKLKNREMYYLGIDIKRKRGIQDQSSNFYVIEANSTQRYKVKEFMDVHKLKYIDFLFIDGNHSMDLVFNDWKYTEWLAPNGTVVFHDTNWHPGPIGIFEAIDEKLFDKELFLQNSPDWGIGVAYAKF